MGLYELTSGITKREALAFKAGGWASIPVDYIAEKYAIPYIKENFNETAFYNKINKFGANNTTDSSNQTRFSHKINSPKYNTTTKMKKYTYRNRSISSRLARVEKMARNNRAEMKSVTWTSSGTIATSTINTLEMTSIGHGTGINERIGDRIKVWRIEIRGEGLNKLDHYILQKHGTQNPTYADFGSGAYAFVDDSSSSLWTEWLSFRNMYHAVGVIVPHRQVLKFPRGIVVKYQDATAPAKDNGLLFVSRNTTPDPQDQNLSIRMWYTDV